MAWVFQSSYLGLPRIGTYDTVARAPLGAVMAAQERSLSPPMGGGEFVYLGGAAGVAAGTLVTYDQVNNTVTVGGTPSSGSPVAFAASPIGAGQYGWYQIGGALNNAAKDGTALTAGGTVGLGTVAGTIGATVATRQLLGARALNAASAGATSGVILINRPVVAQS